MNKEKQNGRIINAEWLIEIVLILILAISTFFMLDGVKDIQGTARIVNYTGIVRGATQRLIKLELAGEREDELLAQLNEILEGLEKGGGTYDLIRLDSPEYQENLEKVIQYWGDLQQEIMAVRLGEAKQQELLSMSENYFFLANNLVESAENFSQHNATKIGRVELLVLLDIGAILILLLRQTLNGVKLRRTNRELKQTAHMDVHTGLPGKNKCEMLLCQKELPTVPTCCIMFDLNGLKKVNDTLGHIAGDVMIASFSDILRRTIPEEYFLGRYGGDEFVTFITNTTKEEVEALIEKIREAISAFNQDSEQPPISFACGYALSADHRECTLQCLLGKADQNMYENKRKMKGER